MSPIKVTLLGLFVLQMLVLVVADSDEESRSCEDLGDKNSHYICDDKGEISCLAGWSGTKCDVPKCKEGCSAERGFCIKPGDCQCSVGWQGENCNQCTPLPGCQRGYCNASSFECICNEGWVGLFCSKPLCRDGCHITRGYCDRPGECKCRIGWGGATCEECKPLPGCIHGNCTKPLECRCEPGWTGFFCQTPVCGPHCNKDHGSCTKPGECRCDVGWWGETCDMCFPYPGCNNGFCKTPWECICEPGWRGMLCDIPDDAARNCSTNPGACLNGGTCIDVPNSGNFTCSCPSLFTGQRCDYLAEVTTSDMTVPMLDPLELTNSPSQIQVVTTDGGGGLPTRSYALDQQPTRKPEGTSRHHHRPELSKDERRALLQSSARIFFRQPKLISKEDDPSDSPPYKVIERKLLPLPVFLPRVSEIIPGEGGLTRILKPVTKQPTPILVLESRSDSDNVVLKDNIPQEPEILGRNQIDEKRRFIRHQQGSPDFLAAEAAGGGGTAEAAADPRRNQQRGLPQTVNKIVRVSRLGDLPLLISAHASALPRPNPVSPATLRTHAITSQHTQASNKQAATPSNSASVLVTQGSSVRRSSLPKTTTTTTTSVPKSSPQVFHAQSRSSVWLPLQDDDDDVVAEGSEGIRTYYDENSNGRVHIGDVIGVDDAAPHDEIYEAFIELKKV